MFTGHLKVVTTACNLLEPVKFSQALTTGWTTACKILFGDVNLLAQYGSTIACSLLPLQDEPHCGSYILSVLQHTHFLVTTAWVATQFMAINTTKAMMILFISDSSLFFLLYPH